MLSSQQINQKQLQVNVHDRHNYNACLLSNSNSGNSSTVMETEQESRDVSKKTRDAAAVPFGLKFADNIHNKFKSSQASKVRHQSSKRTSAKQFNANRPFNVIQCHMFWSQWKGAKGLSNIIMFALFVEVPTM